jgi:AraC-like DNA-binding protein
MPQWSDDQKVRPMTAGAKSLTARATKRVATAPHVWSMPANDVRTFMKAFDRLGYAVDPLLASAAIRRRDLDDPDARIPCEALGAIIEGAQRERFTPNLGLELARVTPPGSSPLLDYLVLTSDTVDAGMRQLAHYFHLVGNPVVFELHEGDEPIHVGMAAGAAPFSIEYVTTLTILRLRAETDGRFAARDVSFRHTPDDAAGFERVLGCPIHSKALADGFRVSRDAWRLPLRRRDPVLRQMLETQANEILVRLPARTGLALEVQRALASRVAGGDTQIQTIARQFAISERTLQRRLAGEGVSYQSLLDDARKEAAARYLSGSTLAICEVAYLVGYSEPAPFHRAFKRWYGVTPEAFRQSPQAAPTAPRLPNA